ncbi:MAG: penicillin acylase family protein, partial [bacterium]
MNSLHPNKIIKIVNFFRIFSIAAAVALLSLGFETRAQNYIPRDETVSGLENSVQIIRDKWGIPTIKAKNDHDLFMGLGYAMAEDRMWQMDGFRRLAQGRTAEVAGQDLLDWDVYNRTVGLGRTARESVDMLRPETLEILQAFADGVNAYIDSHPGKLGFEFLLMSYTPEHWQVSDSLSVLQLIAMWLASDSLEEEMYDSLASWLGDDLALQLFNPIPPEEPDFSLTSVGDESVSDPLCSNRTPCISMKIRQWEKIGRESDRGKINPVTEWFKALASISSDGYLQASNIWAVDGSMTVSGEPILAMDPHLNQFAPSILYEAVLDGGSFKCWGTTFPGMPVFPLGANEHISWGASNLPADCQDKFVETINPQNYGEYAVDDGWKAFDRLIEQIKFKDYNGDIDTYDLEILSSRHGPVINNWGNVKEVLRWTGMQPRDDVSSFIDAMRADSLDSFYEAFRNFTCPTQNLICAESGKGGRIGQILIGKIPIRRGYDGRRPVDGKDSNNDWTGFISYDDLPQRLNPPEGFVAHANNIPIGGIKNGAYPLGASFTLNFRVNRIVECLINQAPLDAEDMRAIQIDVLDISVRETVPFILQAWESKGSEFPDEGRYISYFQNWDFKFTEDSIAASLYQFWLIEFVNDLIISHIPNALSSYIAYQDQWQLKIFDYLGGKTDLDWLKSDDENARDEKILSAFARAIERLKNEAGPDEESWAWGNIHKSVWPHPSGVENLIGAGSRPWGGSRYTIRVG